MRGLRIVAQNSCLIHTAPAHEPSIPLRCESNGGLKTAPSKNENQRIVNHNEKEFPMAKQQNRSRTFDARPDSIDFRDQMYQPTLVEVPIRRTLEEYKAFGVPILNQGQEGACTGFGLATVIHYLYRRRKVVRDETRISPRMLYETAKRYDDWRGENYEGSSARGAIKGWYKHGVCSEALWPYEVPKKENRLTFERASDAAKRPLGAYLRVNHNDLVAMHSAIAEVGILYSTAMVHSGWEDPSVRKTGLIPYDGKMKMLGGHAFAIVGYDEDGFWIQNSWGDKWGKGGFAKISYNDWLANGTDVWVARLGAPVLTLNQRSSAASVSSKSRSTEVMASYSLRPHIVSLSNDGRLRTGGLYGTTEDDLAAIFAEDFPRITAGWSRKRILLYAHGGLTGEQTAVQRLADYLPALLQANVYPISFVWHTDYWSTITNIIEDATKRRRPEGFFGDALDFMLDRLDDMLEPIARAFTGKAAWDEMKENGMYATTRSDGGARLMLNHLNDLLTTNPKIEIHLAGHSAGSIFLAPLAKLLATKGTIPSNTLSGQQGFGRTVSSCTLWAPAITNALFHDAYLPLIESNAIEAFTLFTLKDKEERDDSCAGIYHKSLLYLVANAFEALSPTPILGMEKYIRADRAVMKHIERGRIDWILAPNESGDPRSQSSARHHGDFDDDPATVRATLARILGRKTAVGEFKFTRSASRAQALRKRVTG